MSVTVRTKETKDGKESLYLDIYYNGQRHYKFLELYLIKKPKTQLEKIQNAENREKANIIRLKTENNFVDTKYQLWGFKQTKVSFLTYFKSLTEERKQSTGNYGNWDSAYKILVQYFDGYDKKLVEVNETDLTEIKNFIQNTYRTNANKKLSQNAASSYFNKVKAALNQAFDQKLITDKIGSRIKSIKPEDSHREFLTPEELKVLIDTHCESQMLKNAFLFSAYSGLRWSDAVCLKWGQLQLSDGVYFIKYSQQKTNANEMLFLNATAVRFMGERMADDQKIFKGLKYSAWMNVKLSRWCLKAGITRNITFHCARHTFATQVLSKGHDIYVVSKLLGHKHIKTTQIYAKVIDQRKIDAVLALD